jgi:hypothetical protein
MTEPTTDGLDLVRAVRPHASGPPSEVLGRARSALMHVIDTATDTDIDTDTRGSRSPGRGRRRPARRSRRTIGLAIAAAATIGVGGTAAAGALWSARARTSTSISCFPDASGNDVAVIPASSGDPVADCAAAWPNAFGRPAPDLAAHETEQGGVAVAPRAAGTPAGAVPLPPGWRQDVAVVQLEHELGDTSRGIGDGGGDGDDPTCRRVADAERVVRSQLARLRLDDWTVDNRGDRGGRCAYAVIHGDERRVEVAVPPPSRPATGGSVIPADPEYLRTLPPMPPADADFQLSERLTAAMVSGPGARCTSGAEAAAAVDREAPAVGLGYPGYVVVRPGFSPAEAPDGRTACVRPAVTVGGSTFVYLDVVSVASFEQHR